MPNADNDKPSDKAELASKVTGGLVGGAVGGLAGFLTSGPMGAAAGATIGGAIGNASAPLVEHTFRRGAAEFVQRVLSHREEQRLVTVLDYASAKVERNIQQGQAPRQDDFFDSGIDDRSPADEILEAVLLAAQREPQEKKIPFLANLLANIVFRPDIDRALGNLLIRFAEVLSYQQLVLIYLLENRERHGLIHPPSYHESVTFTYTSDEQEERERVYQEWLATQNPRHYAIKQELFSLYIQAITYAEPTFQAPSSLDIRDLGPSLTDTGKLLYELMELEAIDNADLESTAALLRETFAPPY